ncbi:hypothetical protein G8C92_18765 [Paenibacillus donghaensis]|uniref:hypothetical protein n=1 Tax=Paenibacillus donghaensis TaxID=414771 RepID=UPI0018833826|nr:hypothetical protein [Paenibacillus donghaensis]MBE9916061.1 hypothetical protein [Paenibacillus donghaensis]
MLIFLKNGHNGELLFKKIHPVRIEEEMQRLGKKFRHQVLCFDGERLRFCFRSSRAGRFMLVNTPFSHYNHINEAQPK